MPSWQNTGTNKQKRINMVLVKENGNFTKKFVNLKIRNIRKKMRLDTGCKITIVNVETWKYIAKLKLNIALRVMGRIFLFCWLISV